MAELELHVNEGEETTFLRKERPYWPFVPSPCPVRSCFIFGKFSSYGDFREHWTKKHNLKSSYFQCQSCGKQFSNNKHAKMHTKSRIHAKQTVTIKYLQCDSEEFIDPRDHLPYQLGDKEDRQNMKTYQRHTAAEKRKREIEEKKDDYSNIPYFGPSICRDERVVEKDGELYKDTNMWNSPRKRKRVPLSNASV